MATDFAVSIPALVKWAAAFVVGELLHVSTLVWTLVIFMALDYATGISAAAIRHEISSEAGFRGFLKKLTAIILLLAIHLAESQSNLELSILGGRVQVHIEHFAALGLTFNEFISIIENCARAGAPIPEQLVIRLMGMKKLLFRTATEEQLRKLKERD